MQRLRAVGAIILVLLVSASSFSLVPAAWADTDVVCKRVDDTGLCRLSVTVPSGDAGLGKESTNSRFESKPAVAVEPPDRCRLKGGAVISCYAEGGLWHAPAACAMADATGSTSAELGAVFQNRAAAGGVSLECASTSTGATYWDPFAAAAAGVAAPDPGHLAQVAVSTMDLHPIQLGTFPLTTQNASDHLGYVGWNMWMWVEDPSASTWGPITSTASEGGSSVTATATVSEVVWNMGNGDEVTCGAGTAWREAVSRNEPSPDCGYVYERDGEYTITATTRWSVSWTGMGASGTINMELSSSGAVRIAEVQVVNVAPKNN